MSEHDDNVADDQEAGDEKMPDSNGAVKVNGESSTGHKRSSRDKRKSRSRSRSSSRDRSSRHKRRHRHRRSRSRSKSRSRSGSHSRRRRHRSRTRSRSRSNEDYPSRGGRGRGFGRHGGGGRSYGFNSENPAPSRCLGVFGLSVYTDEKTLDRHFSQFGRLENIQIVYDKKNDRSRGFAFLYYENIDDATQAKDQTTGMEIDGHRIRVDFSLTKRPHTPTPGIYMGKRDYGYHGGHSPRRRSRSFSPRR